MRQRLIPLPLSTLLLPYIRVPNAADRSISW